MLHKRQPIESEMVLENAEAYDESDGTYENSYGTKETPGNGEFFF